MEQFAASQGLEIVDWEKAMCCTVRIADNKKLAEIRQCFWSPCPDSNQGPRLRNAMRGFQHVHDLLQHPKSAHIPILMSS
jgi:hypothetical protein